MVQLRVSLSLFVREDFSGMYAGDKRNKLGKGDGGRY